MKAPVHFDDSLSVFAALVSQQWGDKSLSENLFLRDVTGRLTLIVLTSIHTAENRIELASKASDALGNYVDAGGFAVATPDELFDDRLKDLTQARKISLNTKAFTGEVYLVDRRMVGADWLRDPVTYSKPPIRFVFASIKGGVGRSTALCVLASVLAANGRRVLTIDMDLEAPGLGNMLLSNDTLPEFGLLDYLVEKNLSPIDDAFYIDLVAPSWIGGGHGRIDVVPAIGRRSLLNPSNVLSKIARAYLSGANESFDANQEPSSFTDHMRDLIDVLASPLRYDVVLIDARAGLHETTAAAITGLGAEVFFFGVDQPQTFAGYELLFAHLSTLLSSSTKNWRDKLRFIHAKAPENAAVRDIFSKDMNALMKKYLWHDIQLNNKPVDLNNFKDTFQTEWNEDTDPELILTDDYEAPEVIAILDSDRFRSFNPLADRDLLLERIDSATFGEFLTVASEMVDEAVMLEQSL